MELQMDSDLYAIIKMQPAFGKHAHLVWAYIELFGITPMRAKSKKIRILLEEMKTLFDAGSFGYQKRKYQISQAGIAEALNIVVHRNFETLLDSHNYLKKIMIGISEKETGAAGKTAEKELRKKEDRLRYTNSEERIFIGIDVGEGDKGSRNLTPEQIEENKRRIKDLVKSFR